MAERCNRLSAKCCAQVGTALGARHGLLIRGGDILEKVFDGDFWHQICRSLAYD